MSFVLHKNKDGDRKRRRPHSGTVFDDDTNDKLEI